MNDLTILKSGVEAFDDKAHFIQIWKGVQNAKIALKNIEKTLKERGLEFMNGQGLTSVELDDRYKLIVSKKKKNRFETDAIYKALGFTMEQQSILPKNPSWRKTQILKNEKVSHTHWEEESEEIEIKELDMEFLPKPKK